MKSFIFFILLNCAIFAGASDSPAVPEKTLSRLDKAELSIWKIENSIKGGSGFFVGRNLFVTNDHVISGMLKTGPVEDMVLSQDGNSDTLKINRIVALSVLYDLALLETNKEVADYLTLRETPLESDEPLFVSSYPSGFFKRMKKTAPFIYENERSYAFPVDYSYLAGASGGPVLDEKGQVAGILSKKLYNMSTAIKPNHLREFITGNIGVNCLRFSDPKTCIDKDIENLKKLAEEDSPYAQYIFSQQYESDSKQAFFWCKKAAEQGHITSQFDLAASYDRGNGVQPNLERAFFWVQQAARQGDPQAQHKLAYLYFRGKGVESDPATGFFWLEKAAKQNYVQSQWYLCYMYSKGGMVEKDLEQAFFWCKKAAEQGYAHPQHALANMYFNGEGTRKNLEQAAYWKERAKQDDPACRLSNSCRNN